MVLTGHPFRRCRSSLPAAVGFVLCAALALVFMVLSAPQRSATATIRPVQASATTSPPPTDPNTDDTAPATFGNGLSTDDCVGRAVQLPGCGTNPTQAGDRGGSLQLLLFSLMTAGMVLIAWRIVRSVRQRDRMANG
jgi:hypothetical protein